jgi:hypothetical protein
MNSHDPAQLIEPEIFVFAKERKKVHPGTSGPAAFIWHTLTQEANTLHPRRFLAVFFSPESRENFIQRLRSGRGNTRRPRYHEATISTPTRPTHHQEHFARRHDVP